MKEIYNRGSVDIGTTPNRKKSWRYCLALLFGMFLSVASFGQVDGYTFTQTSGTFTPISGGTSLIAGAVDTGTSPVTNIGFPFTFDGVTYTQFSATSNGWLRLGGTAASSTSSPLSASGAGPAIAFMARDGKTNGAVVYTLTGTSPNRVLTVEYPNYFIHWNSPTNTLNAQIKLFEGTNVVQIVYGASAKATSYTGQVGLVGTANTNFATRTTTTNWSATTAGSANNSTMTWSSTVGPSDGLTYTWTQPTCFSPTLTATTAISETTATINWSAPSTAPSNGYNYEVRTSGAAGSGATGLVSSGAVAAGVVVKDITGLTSATSYSVYVQSNCGSGDTSNWTAAGTFATTCTASSIPYIMPIEAVAVPALPLCTSVQNVNVDGKTWVSYASTTGITGKVMGYSYSGTVAANDWLFTNSLTLNAGSTYQVKFKYKDTGYVEKLKVGIGTSAVNSAMTTTLFDVSTGTSNAVVTQVINFTVPSSGTYTIGFQCYSAANQNVLYLGEISVELEPSCLAPTALVASAVTANTATLSWTASGSNPTNGYDIYYSTVNTAPLAGTAPNVEDQVASPLNVTSLTASSTYYWWVRSDCGSETSTWAPGGSFTTLCEAITSFPWTENFEGVTTPNLPICWSANNVNADGREWLTYTTYGVGASKAAGLHTDYNDGDNNDFLILPRMTLTENQRLKFFVRARATGEPNDYRVVLSTTGNQPADFTNELMSLTEVSSTTMTEIAPIDLSAYSGDVFIAVHVPAGGLDGYYLYVDNFTIEDIPSCLAPTALVSSNIAATTATLSWTASASSPSSGYDIYYSTTNTAPLAGTSPTVNNHTASPLNATSLAPSSTYYWWVRSDCSAETSTWVSGGSFTTTQIAATLPYTQDFSGANNFSFVNGAQINQWVNGSVAGNPGNSIYISNDAGVTNFYAIASTSVTQAYRDIAIPSGTTTATFSFDWNANGESIYDYLRVWLVPTSFVPVAGAQITAGTGRIQVGGNFNQQTTWQTYSNATLDLSSFANATMRLVFEWKNDSSGGTQTPAALDNISLLIPSCVAPTALASSTIATTTATLSWTDSGSNPTNGYDIYYITTNTAPSVEAMPTIDNHTASPLNATGLTPASTYYWWVRSDCDSETSAWAYGGSFTTLCVAFTIPYSENFDTTATGSSTVPSAPTCWSYLETAAGAGYGYTYSFSTPNTTPNHFYLTNSSDNSGSYMLVSPTTTDLSDGSNRVRFYAKASSAGYVLALGTLSDPLDVNSFTSTQAITLTTTYAEYTVNLPAGTDSYLAFKHGLGGTYRSIYIDNVIVENIPSCLEPTVLVSSNIAENTATLSWTASGSNPTNGYDVYYSTTNTDPLAETEATVDNNSTATYNVTGLSSSSTYYWWVRSDCGSETSAWASGGSFTTITPAPTNENCAGAITLGCNAEPATYSSAGSTAVAPAGCTLGSKGIWFSFVGTGADITINSTATFDHKMSMQTGSCGVLTWIACKDGSTGAETYTIENSVLNQTYYVYVAHYGSSSNTTGNITISIACEVVCPTGIWTGTTNSNWNTASNWADNMVPEACTAVTVNVAAPMSISSDVTVASISLGATAVVTVGSTGVLNVGDITVAEGGTMTVASDAAVLQPSLATNSGMVSVQRNSSPLFRQDYTLWSSPVSGQKLRAFSPLTLFNRFSSYDTAAGLNGDYVQEIFTTEDVNTKLFTNAQGYLIRMPNNWDTWNGGNAASSYLGSFKGTLNNGNVTIGLSRANSRMNLVGNPYPSPIDIMDFFGENENTIDNTLYFYRKVGSANPLNTGSGYAAYNRLGGSDPLVIMDNIQTGQGFFVVAKEATSTDLIFTNDMRTNTGTSTFLKSASSFEVNRIWLSLSNATNVVGNTLIGYATGATQGIDNGYDAAYFNDSSLALTSIISNNEFSIQGRSLPFEDTDVVALGFKSDVTGSFTISLANFDGLFAEGQDIFLKDNATNTLQNLKLAGYTFTTQEGVFNDRFEVTYNSTLGTNNPTIATNNILIGVKNQEIRINAGSIVMEKVELIDVAGRVIYTQKDVNATTVTIENVVSANQVLIVRINTKENGVVNKKIVY